MRRGLRLCVLLAAAAVVAPACDDEGGDSYRPGDLERAAGFDTPAQDPVDFAADFAAAPYADERCRAVAREPWHRRELRLFVHPGNFEVQRFTRGLQRYWTRYGVEFYTRHAPTEVPLEWAMDLDAESLLPQLVERFPDVDFDDPEFRPTAAQEKALAQAVFELALAPVLEFSEVYGEQGVDVTNVVFLPRLGRTEPSARAILDGDVTPGGPVAAGLGLSPALLRAFTEPGAPGEDIEFWQFFPRREDFTPMVFINAGLLTDLVELGFPEIAIDLTMAHELGHTFGLPHFERSGNLMEPGIRESTETGCLTALTADQLARVERTLGGEAKSGRPPDDDAPKASEARARRWRRLHAFLHGQGPAPWLHD